MKTESTPPSHTKPASSNKTPRCSGRSGFYTYCGQPSYLGSRLYQPADLELEFGILGDWIELGCGETSTTRLVKVNPDGKLAAAKIIQGDHPEVKFHREVDALHIVQGHPSFPVLIGVVEQTPLRCILQEFVGNDFIPENITLEDVLSKKKVLPSEIPVSDWLQIGQDLSQGLQHLHQQDYCHNNIKPDNILLYPTDGNWRGWRAKICDLGDCTYAKLPPTIHSFPEMKFVAPEVISGQTPFTMAADVYSLGRIIRLIGKAANVQSLRSIGKKCSRKTARKRPDINKVCKMLSKASH